MKKFTDKINESLEDKIPTAKEWLLNHKELSSHDVAYYDEGGYQGVDEDNLHKIMIEFAKFHVEAALKSASEYAEVEEISYDDTIVNKNSILNSYPLDNIK